MPGADTGTDDESELTPPRILPAHARRSLHVAAELAEYLRGLAGLLRVPVWAVTDYVLRQGLLVLQDEYASHHRQAQQLRREQPDPAEIDADELAWLQFRDAAFSAMTPARLGLARQAGERTVGGAYCLHCAAWQPLAQPSFHRNPRSGWRVAGRCTVCQCRVNTFVNQEQAARYQLAFVLRGEDPGPLP